MGKRAESGKTGAIKNVQAKECCHGTAECEEITARWPQCKSFSRPVKNETTL